jgi:hypothetical protein
MDALALPLALVVEEHHVIPTAGRAENDAIRPAQKHHVGQSIVRVGIKDYCILQSLWLVVFAVHDQNFSKLPMIRQVYYCPYIKVFWNKEL